jgi:hypothetical protein
MQVTIFQNFHHNGGSVPLETILENIRNGQYAGSIKLIREAVARGENEQAQELKKALPAFTFSATYNGRRIAAELTHYNGVVMLDFDKLQPGEACRAAALAREIPHTLCCFLSPGGQGLKIGVRPALSYAMNPGNHAQTFRLVADYYERRLGIRADPSGKDAGRLCFVSWDPDTYIAPAPASEALPLMDEAGEKTPTQETARALSTARKQTTRRIKYEEGNRNTYVFHFALKCRQLNINREEVETYALKNFPGLPAGELQTTIASAWKKEYHTGDKNERCKINPPLFCTQI